MLGLDASYVVRIRLRKEQALNRDTVKFLDMVVRGVSKESSMKTTMNISHRREGTYWDLYVPAEFGDTGIPDELDSYLDGYDYTVCNVDTIQNILMDFEGAPIAELASGRHRVASGDVVDFRLDWSDRLRGMMAA